MENIEIIKIIGVVIGILIGIFSIFQYKKFLFRRFSYNVFSLSTIIWLLVSFSLIIYTTYLLIDSSSGEVWGISNSTYKFLIITTILLIFSVLYYYNLRKTNWYFAILNVLIQSASVGIFVIFAIGWIVIKLFSSKTSNSSNPTSESSYNQPTQCSSSRTIKQRWVSNPQEWVFDGEVLKQRWVSNPQEWVFDGRVLKQRWVSNPQEWVFDGEVLKQRWVSNPQEWVFDGEVLKQRWVSNPQEWVFDGKVLKQRWVDNAKEWEICGNIPFPVIAIVVISK